MFTFRLGMAFAGAGILTATVTAILVNLAFAGELSGYLSQQQDRQRAQVVAAVADFYGRSQGWNSIDLSSAAEIAAMTGGSLQVLNSSGAAVANAGTTRMSAGMAGMQRQMGGGGPLGPEHRDPLVVNGKTVGTVVTKLPVVGLAPADARFHQASTGSSRSAVLRGR